MLVSPVTLEVAEESQRGQAACPRPPSTENGSLAFTPKKSPWMPDPWGQTCCKVNEAPRVGTLKADGRHPFALKAERASDTQTLEGRLTQLFERGQGFASGVDSETQGRLGNVLGHLWLSRLGVLPASGGWDQGGLQMYIHSAQEETSAS